MSDMTVVNCPTCNKPVIWGEQSPFRPVLQQALPAYRPPANGPLKRSVSRAAAI
ncbi:DNA gyrase inhibitor YacG [Pluralibacter gergoviae]|nr:DNA gyrase inhibitor YacG [Pluralibacter gergoviae]